MKRQNAMKIGMITFCWMAIWLAVEGQSITIGGEHGVSIVDTPQVIVKQNARYSLWEGVDVAIKSVIDSGISPRLENVLHELDEMARQNDIKLPYSYSRSGKVSFSTKGNGKTRMGRNSVRRTLTPQNKQRKEDFEKRVAARLLGVLSKMPRYARNVTALVPQEPTPEMFSTKDAFINAYVAYKMKTVDEQIKATYAKKIGGLGDYKRDVKREAEVMWNRSK